MFHEKKERFIKMPYYEGGQKALKQFISDNLKYPEEAGKHKIEGTVQVFFIIGNKGNVIEAKIINSLGYGCDEEALRVIKLLKFKIPKTHNVKPTFNKKINIHFHYPKEKTKETPAQQNLQLNYSVITSLPKEINKTNSIIYTIKLDK